MFDDDYVEFKEDFIGETLRGPLAWPSYEHLKIQMKQDPASRGSATGGLSE